MCRLAAYLGKKISLAEFLQEPDHSLVKQSWAPLEMADATLNADGFGVAWVSDNKQPCTYKNVMPIWSDTNLESLGHSLNSHVWLANVRSATPGQGISEENTQPFIKDNLIFTHNGYLQPFDTEMKTKLLDVLSNKFRAEINGSSDSLYLFALLQQYLQEHQSLPLAIKSMLADLKSVCGEHVSGLLNFIIHDGESLFAVRHAINGDCPSLYYLINNDSVSIASEPLTPKDNWVSLPENSFIHFSESKIIDEFDL